VRALGLAIAIALTLVAGSAAADDTVPTKREVHEARAAAQAKERDVASVQADLVLANQRLQASAVEAAQAAEAWNGARYRLEQAQLAAVAA
jgi:peptidoglycan DL-endopeptidase CwlO